MRLVELSVTNFRSLGDVQGIPIHKQTILTGHNDCGKTATLDAIAFLLGERPLADSDISQFAESEPARAALPSDEDAAEPIAVTVEGRFDLSDAEKKALGLPSSIQVRRRHVEGEGVSLEWLAQVPQNPALRNISSLKASELRSLASDVGVKLREGQPNVKASWTEVLEEHAASAPTVAGWAQAPEHVVSALPQLLYFRGDAAETPDTVVRSILTAKLREYTLREETRQKITDLETDFSGLLKDDAARLQKLVEERCGFDSFSLEPTVQFRPTVSGVSMTAAAPGQRAVSLAAAGAGRSRRISLALWEASQQLLSEAAEDGVTGGVIIAYDEPDTHLDYEHQRRIMDMIKVSASAAQSTVIVATHSLNLIDGVDIQDIVHLNSRDGRAYVQSLGAEDTDEDTRRFPWASATVSSCTNGVSSVSRAPPSTRLCRHCSSWRSATRSSPRASHCGTAAATTAPSTSPNSSRSTSAPSCSWSTATLSATRKRSSASIVWRSTVSPRKTASSSETRTNWRTSSATISGPTP